MKKGDVFIAVFLLCFSIFTFIYVNSNKKVIESGYVRVTVEGKEVKKIIFDDSVVGKIYRIETPYGYNIVEMGDKKVRIKEDDSPDQIAVRKGWISTSSDTLVCLPHKLVVEIISDEETDIDHINY